MRTQITDVDVRRISTLDAPAGEVWETVAVLDNGRVYYCWSSDNRWCGKSGKFLAESTQKRLHGALLRYELDETPRGCGGVAGGCDICLALYGADSDEGDDDA